MVSERFQKFMENEKVTAAKLADILEVQPSAISHILSGRNKPSFDLILKLTSKFPRFNIEWLITGKGNMYKVAIQQSLFDSVTNTHINTEPPKKNIETNQDDSPNTQKITNVNSRQEGRTVKKIVMFYSDNTFDIFSPGKSE